jgi:FkbM family methyltransferase
VTVDTSNGRLTLDSEDWLIGKYLYVRRQYEDLEARKAISLLKTEGYLPASPDVLLDVGANIGMTCIGLVRAGYFQRAVAFEPTPNSYRLLTRNIDQNGLGEKILCFPFALSSRSGSCRLEISEDNSGDNRIQLTSQRGFFKEERRGTIEVPAKTLDQALAEHPALGDGRIDLVWADVQGHEGHLFRGGERLLGRGVPVVSEFWPYAILRSGTSQGDFQEIVSRLFTDFYLLSEAAPTRRPISQVEALFEDYSHPRQMCLVAWVHAGRRARTPL